MPLPDRHRFLPLRPVATHSAEEQATSQVGACSAFGNERCTRLVRGLLGLLLGECEG
jgi:hypothetical protein